jgi:hypothetical protein
MKRHIVRAAVAAAAVAGITGCQAKQAAVQPQQQQQQAPLQQQQQPAPPQPVAQGEQPPVIHTPVPEQTGADLLKMKTEQWAREVTPQLTKRARKGEPSAADFLEPDQFSLTPISDARRAAPPTPQGEAQVVPVSNPVNDATPSVSNQGGQLSSAAVARVNTTASNVGRVALDPTRERRDAEMASRTVRDTSTGAGDLELSLGKNLKDNPKDLWAQLDFQLLQFLKDKPTPQLESMTNLPGEDRELISSVMDALTNFRNALRADNNMLMSRKVRPILDLADRVRAQADLVIPTLALCTKVDGFGIYEPIEPRFTAMKAHEILIYCEVENFASHQNGKKMWETKLSQEVVLYTETGLPVWQDKSESIPDLARSRRHDFFVYKRAKFPANITLGRYLLKVTMVDQQASRVAEATIPVQFVAQ